MKAVVLAAGEGSRLRPLTNRRPKPMLPVGNKPLLESVIESIAAAGVDEIVLVVGYHRERIQTYFGDGRRWNVDITYAVQEKQLGTGHALLQAEPYIGSDFIAMNGDRYIEPSAVEKLIDDHRQTGAAGLATTRVETPSRFGVVERDKQTVTDIIEKPIPGTTTSEQINAGVYVFGPDIFAAIRQTESRGELALTRTLRNYVEDHPLRAIPYDGLWGDVSHPWDLLWLNGYVLDKQDSIGEGDTARTAHVASSAVVHDDVMMGEDVTVRAGAVVCRGTSVGENATVCANAVVEDAVVFPDATIEPGAVVRDCIVGANATIGPNTTVEGGVTDVTLDDTVHHDVTFGGLIGDNARISGNVTVLPGAIVGDGVTVESGTTVRERIEDGAVVRRG
ncbi:sugar phosphate nucleotidyltransferase (plasmid) [Haladaptatus sp. SPP-AMP-3]|uniref:sugar phosphate nucleotidyltransferase n=1 Tax=Haladaptatus sp. SPP-AMP-3 TaxID=3121295 RepID=UPI003C2F6021